MPAHIATSLGPRSSRDTNERSIFSTETGNRRRYDSDE